MLNNSYHRSQCQNSHDQGKYKLQRPKINRSHFNIDHLFMRCSKIHESKHQWNRKITIVVSQMHWLLIQALERRFLHLTFCISMICSSVFCKVWGNPEVYGTFLYFHMDKFFIFSQYYSPFLSKIQSNSDSNI